MNNKLQIKRSTLNNPTSLEFGEPAVKDAGGFVDFYIGDENGNPVKINGWGNISGTLSNQTDLQNKLDLKEDKANKNQPNGYAGLEPSGLIPTSLLPSIVFGGLGYEGAWNATTNTPTITSGVGITGRFYKVNVAGSTLIDGINVWNVGDWIIFNGTVWQKVENTDSVISVNGQNGIVNLTQTDVGLANVDNTSDLNKPISNATQTALDGKQDLILGATANNFVFTDGTGQVIDSGLDFSTDGFFTSNSDATIPSEKAIKTYVDNAVTTNNVNVNVGVGRIIVGNNLGVATPVLMTGAVTINDAGVTSISDGSITSTKIAPNITLTGNPTAPTQPNVDNSTKIATTAFVSNAVSNLKALSNGTILVGNAGNVSEEVTLAPGEVLLGDSNSLATPTAVTGDVTISNSGFTSIGVNKVTNAKLEKAIANTWKGNNMATLADVTDNSASALTSGTPGVITIGGANANKALLNPASISISQASSSTNGYLSSIDWNRFNNKPSLSGSTTPQHFAFFNNTTGTIIDDGIGVETTLTPNANKIPTSSAITTALNGKQNLIASPTLGNLAAMSSTGQTTNSGYSVETTLTSNANRIPTSLAVSNALRKSDIEFWIDYSFGNNANSGTINSPLANLQGALTKVNNLSFNSITYLNNTTTSVENGLNYTISGGTITTARNAIHKIQGNADRTVISGNAGNFGFTNINNCSFTIRTNVCFDNITFSGSTSINCNLFSNVTNRLKFTNCKIGNLSITCPNQPNSSINVIFDNCEIVGIVSFSSIGITNNTCTVYPNTIGNIITSNISSMTVFERFGSSSSDGLISSFMFRKLLNSSKAIAFNSDKTLQPEENTVYFNGSSGSNLNMPLVSSVSPLPGITANNYFLNEVYTIHNRSSIPLIISGNGKNINSTILGASGSGFAGTLLAGQSVSLIYDGTLWRQF